MNGPILPPPLHAGDLIAVAAPAGAVKKRELLRGIEHLAGRGFRVTYRDDIFDREGYFAGGDRRRAEELNGWIADPGVRAILMARGGYGSSRLFGLIDLRPLRRRPKIIVGYSDITALLLAVGLKAQTAVFHGPFVSDPPRDLDRLLRTLRGPSCLEFPGLRTLRPGRAAGLLTGGNLSLLCHSLGTPFEVDTRGRILFLEEVNEPMYRIDRMLRQLALAGKFRALRGIVAGRFTGCGSPRRRIDRLLLEAAGPRNVPVAAGFPSGHGPGNRTFPLGVTAVLDSSEGRLSFGRFLSPEGR